MEYMIKYFDEISDFYNSITIKAEDIELNSPFQYETWQSLLYFEHITYHKNIPYVGVQVYKNNLLMIGAHFFLKLTGRRRGFFILGSGGETDYHDFIYFNDSVSIDDIQFLIENIYQKYSLPIFTFLQIRDNSPLSLWAKDKGINPYHRNECAQVKLTGSYEEYLKSLKKSVRQNIRTANNRIQKDSRVVDFVVYEEKSIPIELKKELLNLYETRRTIKNKREGNRGVKFWFYEKLRIYRKRKYNIIEKAMSCSEKTFLSVYKIDGLVAAYCFGLKDNSSTICIMQVAINDKFERYSPGMLLLTNVFKISLKDKKEIIFDLTNGNETYKFSLGAKSKWTNYYKFNLLK